MDFDPSQFLAMEMSEDRDDAYSAPGQSQPVEEYEPASGPIIVEGGLQMEQDLQIPVPVFGMLNQEEGQMDYSTEDPNNVDEMHMIIPLQVEITEPNARIAQLNESTVQNSSPAEKTSSPHIKKMVPTSYEESRFRKDFFCGNYDRVKLFRLHCTICDRHLGCAPWFTERQMRTHKIFSVSTCRQCSDFFGDINFPIEDGSEIYCCWCGEGGEVFCCSKCPKIVCKKCVKRNFGEDKVKDIDKDDNWMCFVCDSTDIWPHRALFWGWQRLAREMRQNVASLTKEERQARLSKDTSLCCQKSTINIPTITLPRKNIMSKIPLCMIANVYRQYVLNQPNHQISQNSFLGSTTRALLTNGIQPSQTAKLPRPQQAQSSPQVIRQNQLIHRQTSGMYQTPNPQMLHRFVPNVRPAPYPPMTQIVSFPNQLPSSTQRFNQAVNTSYPSRNTIVNRTAFCSEIISVDDDSPPKITPNKQSHDIAWLEKGVYEIKGALASLNSLTDQFLANKDTLKYELSKATDLSEKLTTGVKQAIITMAKINEDISTGRKAALEGKINAVVKDASAGISSIPSVNIKQIQITKRFVPKQEVNVARRSVPSPIGVNSSPNTDVKQTPKKALPPIQPETPEQTGGDDDADEMGVNPALLCETVLHIEGNKENNDGNKSTSIPQTRRTPQKTEGRKLTRPRSSYVKITARKSFPKCSVEIIDLVDDRDSDNYLCKRFNIRPCKVLLKRLNNIQ